MQTSVCKHAHRKTTVNLYFAFCDDTNLQIHDVGVDGVAKLGSRANSMLRKQPSGSGRRWKSEVDNKPNHSPFLSIVFLCLPQLPYKQTNTASRNISPPPSPPSHHPTFLPSVYSGAAQVKPSRVLPQASGSSPMLPATSTSIAKENSSRGKTMARRNVTRKGQYRRRRDVSKG